MRGMNRNRFRDFYEASVRDGKEQEFLSGLEDALAVGEMKPSDFSIREFFEDFLPDVREI
ncbi:MAG: hypothetical protein IID46_12660, partial [Planctomycetes bacterium]|nr:hypothetical protein [Planctomycetota bacterium]